MERNIFSSIQLPGSKPGDANWEYTKWGYRTLDELMEAMCGDSSESPLYDGNDKSIVDSVVACEEDVNCILNGTKIKLIVGPILNEPLASANIKNTFLNDGNDQIINCAYDLVEFMNNVKKKEQPKVHQKVHNNRQLAIIRRKDCANQFKFKNKLDEVFWPVDKWPAYVLNILLSDEFKYQDRLSLATFFHGNGLPHYDLAVNAYKFYNKFWRNTREWDRRFFEFTKLWEYLDKTRDPNCPEYQRIRTNYYYYSLMENHMMYYDGNLRVKGGQRRAFKTHPYN